MHIRGINNPGAACYAISVVQCLRATNLFSAPGIRNNPVSKMITDVSCPIGEIISAVNQRQPTARQFSPYQQEDADAFYLNIMDQIPEAHDAIKARRQSHMVCPGCRTSKRLDIDPREYQIYVAAGTINTETIMGDESETDQQCNTCRTTLVKYNRLARIADVVCVHVTNAGMDYNTEFQVKAVDGMLRYRMCGVVYYIGAESGYGGHYYALCRYGEEYYILNDSAVVKLPEFSKPKHRPRLIFYKKV